MNPSPPIRIRGLGKEPEHAGLEFEKRFHQGKGLADLREINARKLPCRSWSKSARSRRFKEDIIQAFYDGIRHKPQTTFGNVKADVLADKDPHFTRSNFCSVIRRSAWHG